MVRVHEITKYIKFGNTTDNGVGEQGIALQIFLCFSKLQHVTWFVIMYNFCTWKMFSPFMKELVHYMETVLNCGTISQSLYPVELSGIPSLYGKKQNDNTGAIFKTFL